jgi:hypothetical protein
MAVDRHHRIVVQVLVENVKNPPCCRSQPGFAHSVGPLAGRDRTADYEWE